MPLPPPANIHKSGSGSKPASPQGYYISTPSEDSGDDGHDATDSDLLLYVEAMHSQPTVLCGRAVIAQEYGQELYLSDLSEDEAPTKHRVAAIRKSKDRVRTLRFAEYGHYIQYDEAEGCVVSTEYDKISDFYDDEKMDKVCKLSDDALEKANDTLRLLDTQTVKESTIGFTTIGLWSLARAVARARAVYARFLYLISQLPSMQDYAVPLFMKCSQPKGSATILYTSSCPLCVMSFSSSSKRNRECCSCVMSIP